MIKKLLCGLAIAVSLLTISTQTRATHIMGGSINYQYLGIDSATGFYNYQITLELFRLCDPGSSNLPLDMNLGVYQDDSLNPNGDKLLVLNTLLPLILQQAITPPAGNASCTFVPNVCVEEGVYQAIVSVPPSSTGYYFISDRCCRNNTIVNLNNPGNDGEAYFASCPAPSIVNSSPTFAAVPVPFICAADTFSVLNQAYDADGDLLVYNFGTPYNGISDNTNPNPNPPVTYPWPIPTVAYAATYSVLAPFGPGGYVNMNNNTGLASYYAPNQGFYVVAVEIQEFRNGTLIGVSRRDIQIIVIPCPVNPSPVLSSTTSQTSFTIDEGDTLCFNNTFTDANGDSIYISHTGNIFNGAVTNPPATYIDSSGLGLATGQFCWITSCGQGNPVPYQFTVVAQDNGCPAKITNIVYSITVNNTPKPTPITGPDTLCFNSSTGLVYSVPSIAGVTYLWNVTNGTIIGSSTGNSVTINFSGSGTAVISAAAVNHNGCLSDTVAKVVVVNAIPVANAGPDKNFCGGGTATLGVSGIPGYTYTWFPTTGLSNPNTAQTLVSLTNSGTIGLFITYILTVTSNGCTSTDTVVVNVKPTPVLSAGPDASICTGNTVVIGLLAVPGQTYTWSPAGGLSSTTISNPTVTLINSGTTPISQTYVVTVSNTYSCFSTDSVTVTVNAIPAAIAGPDVAFCSGGSATLGTTSTVGYSYSWSPLTGLSNPTLSNPIVTLTNLTTQNDTIYYVVTTSQSPCVSHDTVMVIVQPNPISNAGADQFFCSGGTATLGTTATTGYTYSWSPSTGLSSTTVSDPVLTFNNTNTTPDTLTYVVTTTLNGCVTTDTVQIIVNPVPTAVAGPDVTFCSGFNAVIGSATSTNYTYSWSPSAGLSNSTISNPTVTATNTTGVNDTLIFVLTTTLFGCTDSDTVQVIVEPSPVSNAGPNQFFCSGDSTTLGTTTTTGYTYSWSPSTGLSSTTVSDPVLTWSNTNTTPDTLTYIVTTTLNNCVTTDTVQIIISPVPIAIAGPDVIYCSGSSAVLGTTTSTNYTYNWSPSTGLSSSTVSNPTVTLTNSTGANDTLTYIVTTNLFGCFASDTVQVVVKPNPISNAGTGATLCGGDTIQLGTTSTTGYTYSWSPTTGLSGTTISDPILIVVNSGAGQTSTTYVVSTTLNGCTTTDSVTILVNPQPTVVASANPGSICLGDSTTLTASGAATYSWALSTAPGTVISTSASFVVSPTTNTTYILTGTTSSSCSNTSSVTINVSPLPLVQITNASNNLCLGDTITLTATGASSYTWSVLGGASIGTGASVQVSPSVNTTYVVIGVNSGSCSNSDTISIVVNPAATLTGLGGTLSVCPGITGVQYWVLNPNASSSYTWTITNGTIVSGQNTDTITVDWSTTPGTGTISVFETTTLGCESSVFTLTITINTLLTPPAPTGPTSFCANSALGIVYSALNTSGSTFNWFAQGGNIVSGNGTSIVTVDWTAIGPVTVALWYEENSITAVDTCFGTSDTLYVTLNPAPITGPITGPSGICIGDTGTFSVSNTASSSYVWSISNGTILSGSGTNSITANWTTTGNATITVIETNAFGCSDTVTIPVTINGLPSINAGSDVGVCIGQGVQLSASGGATYSWTPTATLNNANIFNPFASPTTATTYIVLGTDGNGCKNTDTVVVSVNALPVITLTPNSDVCIGGSIQLTAGGGNTYQWSPGGTLSNSNINNPVASPSSTTTYTVVVSDNNTCVDSANVTITVNPLPTIDAISDITICEKTSTTLSATGGVSYSWSPASSLNNSTISNPIATPATATTYTVTGTDSHGCSNTDQVTVNLNVNPQASFDVKDGDLTTVTCEGYFGTLTNTTIDGIDYNWTFPNGTTSTDFSPSVQFNLAGNNVITLIAINNMCSDTATVDFASTIIGKVFDKAPNIITPNGDGKNDCFDFGPTINLDECSTWEIFNRWGKKVFTSSSEHPCWNGKKDGDGADLSTGTYYYIVTIEGETYKGVITLLR